MDDKQMSGNVGKGEGIEKERKDQDDNLDYGQSQLELSLSMKVLGSSEYLCLLRVLALYSHSGLIDLFQDWQIQVG